MSFLWLAASGIFLRNWQSTIWEMCACLHFCVLPDMNMWLRISICLFLYFSFSDWGRRLHMLFGIWQGSWKSRIYWDEASERIEFDSICLCWKQFHWFGKLQLRSWFCINRFHNMELNNWGKGKFLGPSAE